MLVAEVYRCVCDIFDVLQKEALHLYLRAE